jgi:hypothetical protein
MGKRTPIVRVYPETFSRIAYLKTVGHFLEMVLQLPGDGCLEQSF